MRLRYEIRREFAPYVGIEWTGKFGDTADLARSNDEAVRDAHVVAGLRFWF
jgi:copper resistance protein B